MNQQKHHFTNLLLVLAGCLAFTVSQAQRGDSATAGRRDTVVTKRDTAMQTDLIDVIKRAFHIKLKKPESEPGKKVYYSLLPISSNVPGGGRALVTSTTAGFYLGNRSNTYISGITFAPYFNFKGRYGFPFKSNLWLSGNKWNLQGDTRLMVYPQYTWGLGGNNTERDKVLVNYNYFRFYHSALRRIKPYLLIGGGYYLDYHTNIHTINDTMGLQKLTGYGYGTKQNENSLSSGVTFNMLYDSRSNFFNPLPGMYANLVYRVNPRFLGSNDSWQSLYIDLRKYVRIEGQKLHTMALWGFYWTALNSNVPYLDLPAIGWDPSNRSGRGFDQNRYRGKGLIDFEAEYRSELTSNGLFGFVVFANANSVSEPGTHSYKYIHAAAGAGLRIKFNKRSNTNIALDYGFSKGYSQFYLNLGEVF
ncbi:BamA/TamA family outer membrane protein [Deminuibacter soli]|uniref:Bacterial surface antigen (D15) domain-containing protein n=1 Tax=Deminuibacter soli TaxID=2291815 RepID=A0A3E1NKV1_9BACT|nr:BamA/TamA family outer membrane protein [Deminuibacter soli]RFM28569.1 hypothetical protein DXN05_07155 [Deminuibacter soli]